MQAQIQYTKEMITKLNSIDRFYLAQQIAKKRFYSGEIMFRGDKGVRILLDIIEKAK